MFLAVVGFVVLLGLGIVIGFIVGRASGGARARAGGGQGVPGSWERSHDPEARLHRRIRQVVQALGALPADEVTADVRVAVERAAAALDERLVAVAALPERVRAEPLSHVTREVEGLEGAVAEVTTSTASGGDVAPALRALSGRLALVDAARAEVDSLDSGPAWPSPPEDAP